MNVVHASESEFIETPGSNFGVAVATPTRGAAEVSVIRQRQLPGGANPPHTHDREEVMVILAGEITMRIDDRSIELGPNDAAIVPPGTMHSIENASSEPAEWLLIAPAGVRFFHANGESGSPPWSR
jgi:mannose-6-phosphate isomerase-like protein (cupin superfamily)